MKNRGIDLGGQAAKEDGVLMLIHVFVCPFHSPSYETMENRGFDPNVGEM